MNDVAENPIVAAAREKVEAARQALEEAQKIFDAVTELEKTSPAISRQLASDTIDVNSLPVTDGRAAIADQVRNVICKFGDQEFMVAHVEAALKELGKPITGKSPRSRISIVLKKLEQQGLIVTVFKGRGNVPNKYKINNSADCPHVEQDDEYEPDIDAFITDQRERQMIEAHEEEEEALKRQEEEEEEILF